MQTVEERIKRRRRKIARIRRRRRLRLLLVLMILSLFIWGGIKLFRSSLFNVKKVEIKANHPLSSHRIAQIKGLSGITPDTDLLRLPVEEIENRLLSDPWIKQVEIARDFPSTVKIKVTEREVLAAIPVDDFFALIDDEGYVLERRAEIESMNVPLIKDLKVDRLPQVGERLRSKSLWNAIACLNGLDPSLRKSLSIVSAPSVSKLSLYTREGVEILYGRAEQTKKKNYIIKKIFSEDGGKVIFIDIRVVSNPTVKRLEVPAN